MSNLEDEFLASEQARSQAEQKVRIAKQGQPIPGSPRETLEKLAEFKAWLSQIDLEKEAYDRISAFLLSVEDRVNVKQELKEFSAELAGLADMLSQILSNSQAAKQNVYNLSVALIADLEDREKLRKKQHETLDKLNQYLENWL